MAKSTCFFIAANLFVVLSMSPPVRALNCTVPSSITNDWIIGTTIAQVMEGVVQLLGTAVALWANDYFYKKSHSPRVIERQNELKKLRKHHKKIRKEASKDALIIIQEIENYINDVPSSIRDDDELLDLLQFIKTVLRNQRTDRHFHLEEESTE